MIDDLFYERLKNYFRSQGITQGDIADAFGGSRAYVNQMLNGKCSLGRASAQKFHDLYGLSVAWLLTGDGDMFDQPGSATFVNIKHDGNKVSGTGNVVADNGASVETARSPEDIATITQLRQLIDKQQQQINDLIQILKARTT